MPVARSSRKWEDNVKTSRTDWIIVSQGTKNWRYVVNNTELQVP